jgi:DNA-binding transcriptional MocR family regulator
VTPDRIVICGGAQHAINALLSALTEEGDAVATEIVTYQGFKAIADLLHRPVVGLAVDELGIVAAAFGKVCRAGRARALYCTPALHNPTGSVMPVSRRRAIARVARDHGVAIIEDDVYGPLLPDAPASLCSHVPELGYFIASVSKVVSPGLRLAYVVAPTDRDAARIAATVRATAWMATPLTAEIATHWIRNGTAERIIAVARDEVARRQKAARAVFRRAGLPVRGDVHAIHLWLELPKPWTSEDFARHVQRAGVLVMPADAFAVAPYSGPPAVRLSLTGAPSVDSLVSALERVAALAGTGPGQAVVL